MRSTQIIFALATVFLVQSVLAGTVFTDRAQWEDAVSTSRITEDFAGIPPAGGFSSPVAVAWGTVEVALGNVFGGSSGGLNIGNIEVSLIPTNSGSVVGFGFDVGGSEFPALRVRVSDGTSDILDTDVPGQSFFGWARGASDGFARVILRSRVGLVDIFDATFAFDDIDNVSVSGGLDHFKCYEVEDGNDLDLPVSLEDQFQVGPALAEVEEPELFCNPVAKTVGQDVTEIGDPTAHLTGYELDEHDEDFEALEVTVTNQFGEEQVLVIEEPELLLVPSEKDGVASALNLDHFQCYEVDDGNDVDVIVGLEDQFGVEVVEVQEPKLFCNPVDKNGEGILDPLAHLTCYEIEGEDVDMEILVQNQLDFQSLELEEAELLCVPSEKLAVVPHEVDEEEDDDDEEEDDDD